MGKREQGIRQRILVVSLVVILTGCASRSVTLSDIEMARAYMAPLNDDNTFQWHWQAEPDSVNAEQRFQQWLTKQQSQNQSQHPSQQQAQRIQLALRLPHDEGTATRLHTGWTHLQRLRAQAEARGVSVTAKVEMHFDGPSIWAASYPTSNTSEMANGQ